MPSQEACSTLSAQMGTPQGALSVKSPSWRDLWPPPSSRPLTHLLLSAQPLLVNSQILPVWGS